MLEGLNIPFTGRIAHNMHFTLDKEKTKLVADWHMLRVPTCIVQLFRTGLEALSKLLLIPLIVNASTRERQVVGIYHDSGVVDETSLRRR